MASLLQRLKNLATGGEERGEPQKNRTAPIGQTDNGATPPRMVNTQWYRQQVPYNSPAPKGWNPGDPMVDAPGYQPPYQIPVNQLLTKRVPGNMFTTQIQNVRPQQSRMPMNMQPGVEDDYRLQGSMQPIQRPGAAIQLQNRNNGINLY